MDIRPEIGVQNPSWFGKFDHLYRGDKEYSNDKLWELYNRSPETYRDILEDAKERANDTTMRDWEGNERPKTQDEIGQDRDYVEEWLDMNNRMAWDDPHSPVQRMKQPMGTYMKIGWKDGDGNYTRSDSYNRALDSPDTGGAFKDALLAMDDDDKQEWLNNNYGGRGLGYMGQNAYPSLPMDQRKANVQANARPALIRQLARMNRPKVPAYGAGLFQFGKMPWQ